MTDPHANADGNGHGNDDNSTTPRVPASTPVIGDDGDSHHVDMAVAVAGAAVAEGAEQDKDAKTDPEIGHAEPTATAVEDNGGTELSPPEVSDASDEDGALAVAVTGVEADAANSVGAAALLLGATPYTVELAVTSARSSYCIRRGLAPFEASLAAACGAMAANGGEFTEGDQLSSLEMYPAFPSKNAQRDAALAQWCDDVTQYLATHGQALSMNPEWRSFLAEHDGDGRKRHIKRMSAIEFILQPFPYEKFYVPRGSLHEVVVPVKKNDQYLVWKFDVEDHDIDFAVHFLPAPAPRSRREVAHRVATATSDGVNGIAGAGDDEVAELLVIHATTRYLAATGGDHPVEGAYECPGVGTATLVWDNAYSRLRGKNIQYQVQVVHKSIMSAATAAADAFDAAAKAKEQRDALILSAKTGTQLVVHPALQPSTTTSSTSFLLDTSAHLYRHLFADKLSSQNWLVSAPLNVAGKLASSLFGSPAGEKNPTGNDSNDVDDVDDDEDDHGVDAATAKSLLEELNGLNMQLLERLESCEDTIAKLTAERDQERSKLHMATVEKENGVAALATKDMDLEALRSELQRIDREREAWRGIQQERDALLEEKHRWAMADEFITEDDDEQSTRNDLDSETRIQLEHELGRAEAGVLRLRAELGYSLSNHLTGTSTRLEKIAQEMAASKKEYEDHIAKSEQATTQLKQQVIKYRSQKRVLIAELRNIQTQSESQVAVAMAEANEARMVNKRLKTQNELLLTQIRSLVDDSREQEKRLQDEVEQKIAAAKRELLRMQDDSSTPDTKSETLTSSSESTIVSARENKDDPKEDKSASDLEYPGESSVPYTLSASDVALLNGQGAPSRAKSGFSFHDYQANESDHAAIANASLDPQAALSLHDDEESYRSRLIAFFQKRDPSMLPEVDSMLESYAGVEGMLFESLELKYSFFDLRAQEQDDQ